MHANPSPHAIFQKVLDMRFCVCMQFLKKRCLKRDSDSPMRQISSKAFVSRVQMSKRCNIRRVMAKTLQNYDFGPSVVYYLFPRSEGPNADDIDLGVNPRSTSGQFVLFISIFWYICLRLTPGQPRVDLEFNLVGTGLVLVTQQMEHSQFTLLRHRLKSPVS